VNWAALGAATEAEPDDFALDTVFHCSRSHLPLAVGDAPVAIALGEKLEVSERAVATADEFVGTDREIESLPDDPRRVGGCGATKNDAGFDG
jgi:hypothetical protein